MVGMADSYDVDKVGGCTDNDMEQEEVVDIEVVGMAWDRWEHTDWDTSCMAQETHSGSA